MTKLCIYYSFWYKHLLFTNKDKFIKNILETFINNNNIFIPMSIDFYIFTHISTFTSALDLLNIYINMNL